MARLRTDRFRASSVHGADRLDGVVWRQPASSGNSEKCGHLVMQFSMAAKMGYRSRPMTAPRSATPSTGPIILFDAKCVLCSANARFVLERDRKALFRLASMQGEIGQSLYRRHGMDPDDPASLLVVEGDQMRRDSDAVLSIYERLGFPWSLMRVFRIIPAALRDPVYLLVARHRYRLFGRRDTCWVAPQQYKDRIL